MLNLSKLLIKTNIEQFPVPGVELSVSQAVSSRQLLLFPMSQRRKPRFREGKSLADGHCTVDPKAHTHPPDDVI